jgi:ferric-dicitrate binding protein FerR (iron transport regulator)
MSDDIVEAGDMADVELLTRFLNRQLNPEQDARVRERIENDANFREFAAPLILAWSVPPRWQRHPRPPGERERMWDEFTKRAGFVYQRRAARKRKLWMLGIAVLAIALSSFVARHAISDRYVALTKYRAVADSGREMRLRDSAFVTLKPGTKLRSSRKPLNLNSHNVILAGSARFRVEQSRTESGTPRGLIVQAGDAMVASAGAVFDVATHGDTTFVQVVDRQYDVGRANGLGVSIVMPEGVLVANKIPTSDQLMLKSGESARVVRGHKPELLRRAPVAEVSLPPAATQPGAPRIREERRIASVRAPGAGVTISSPVPQREQETHTAYMSIEVMLSDGTHARLDSGAVVQTPLVARAGETYAATLKGSARFIALREAKAVAIGAFGVATAKTYIATQRADFAVRERGDTVEVEVFHRKHASVAEVDRVSVSGTNDLLDVLVIEEGRRARSVGGRPAVVVTARKQ